MDAQELRNLQEAYNQVYQVDESSISDRAKNAVADQRLSDAQSSTQRSVNRLRNMPTVTRSTAALAARAVERDVKKSNSYGPQRPKPGTVTGRRIEEPKPTGSKPKVSRLGGSSSLSGVGGSAATGGYQVGGSRGYGISGIRLADHYDVYDIILSHLLDEGYVNDEKSAFAIMANMSESWKQSILEMDDFAAGGGNAKMKQTGMTRDQVVALGKKNLAAKPASSSSSSSSTKPQTTSSDVVRDRLASREKYRDTVNQARAAGVRGPVGLLKRDAARDQEDKFNKWYEKNQKPGPNSYYKPGYKNLPGTFEKG